MNFKVGKSKKLAIAACLLGGMFLGNTAAASDAVYHSPVRGGIGLAKLDMLDFDEDFYPDKVVVGDGKYVFAKDSLVDVDGDKKLNLEPEPSRDPIPSPISGAIYIKHKQGPEFISVKAEKKLTLQIDAEYGAFAGINDTKMGTKLNVTAGEEGYVIVNSGLKKGGSVPTDPYDCKKGVGIDAGFNTENVKINVSAPITLNVGGRTGSIGVRAGRDSVVNITNDLEINLNNKTKEAYAFQMLRNNSKVNVNYADGGVKDAAVKTAVTGDIYTEETALAYGDKKTGAEVNMGLSGKDSFFKGAVLYKEGIKSYGDFSDEEDRDVYSAGKVRLALENGASWINEMQGEHDLGMLKNRNGQDVEAFKGSRIYALTGSKAEDASSVGVIYQKDSKDIVVENYSGNTVVFYEHNAEKPAEIIGGDFVINYVDEAGKIKLVTDNKGLNFAAASAEDEKLASETMNALAGKLLYTTFQDEALNGEVEIAEGLTLAAKTLKKGSITFNNDASEDYREDLEAGRGFYQEGVKEDGDKVLESSAITLNYRMDKKKLSEYITLVDDNKKDLVYDFGDKTTVKISTDGSGDWAPIGMTPRVKAELNAAEFELSSKSGMMGTYGIYAEDNDDITINGDVSIHVDGGAFFVSGIYMGHMGTGAAHKTDIRINGNLSMRGTGDNPEDASYWGVQGTGFNGGMNGEDGKPTMSTRWAPSAIYLGKEGGSTITVNGTTDIRVKGHGAVVDAFWQVEGENPLDNVITLKGGRIEVEKNENYGLYALGAFGGTINMNMNDSVSAAADNDVELYGNIIAMKDDHRKGNDKYFRDGAINLGLSTDKSSWTGVIDNTGTKQAGNVNIHLQNGAIWQHEAYSKANGIEADTMPTDSKPFYGNYDGVSHVNSLSGGINKENSGVIYQNYAGDIKVNDYSGNTVVFYEHKADAPTEMIGGDFVITKAADNSYIKLVTDNAGLSMKGNKLSDKAQAHDVLGALAAKAVYEDFAAGKLSGEVEIAEGLTTEAASLKLEKIQFTGEGGRGEVVKEEEEVVEDLTLTEAITDNYKLSGDTTVNINKATLPVNGRNRHAVAIYNASMHSKGNPMVVDLNNHALDINVDFTEDNGWNQARGIFVDNNTYVNLTNSAPDKAVNISIKNDAGCSSQAIYLNNGTHLKIDSDVNIKEVSAKGDTATAIQVQGQTAALEINGNLTIKDVFAKGRRSGEKSVSGIKVVGSEHSKVVVNGLVDIRGIKGAALRNEGSNSYIGVGGGVIEAAENKALDKAYRAVEVGQGTSEINMQGEEAGTDTVQITGNMFTTGEFKKEVIEYSGGKKFREVKNHGTLNVALVNSESFWKGALTYAEYTDYYGEDHSGGFTRVEQGDFNMYLQNGASWTNELQAAALTKLEAQKSEWKGSRVNKLIGGSDKAHAGVIFQKDANNISVNDYSGNTVVFYEHKADAPTEMIGGDFVITKAADNSYIKLVTDSKGLNFADAAADGKKYVKAANNGEAGNNAKDGNKVSAADKNLASETMNALAAKLLYTANDGKLSGEVEIAEGLTTEAKQLKIGDISFRTEDNEEEGYKKGQGWYEYEVEKEDPVDPKPENPEQTVTVFDKAITGGADEAYVTGGVKQGDGSYLFTENSSIHVEGGSAVNSRAPIMINAEGKTLTLEASELAEGGANTISGIKLTTAGDHAIAADKVILKASADDFFKDVHGILMSGRVENEATNLELNSDLIMDVQAAQKYSGIEVLGNAAIEINGKVIAKGTEENPWAISAKELGSKEGASFAAVYAGVNTRDEDTAHRKGATININNIVDLNVDGSGVVADGGNSTVYVKGGNINILKSENNKRYAVLATNDATVNINTDGETAGNEDVVINGNIGVEYASPKEKNTDKKSILNIALNTEKSMLNGVVFNNFIEKRNKKGYYGYVNMELANGAVWNNVSYGKVKPGKYGFHGSKLETLKGGSDKAHAGVIFQKDANNISVNDYSGNTVVFYEHKADAPTEIIGGDFVITKAADNSYIKLVTDNAGLSMKGNKLSDKAQAHDVLGALAAKAVYEDFAAGKLSGEVEIAEGLTTEAASLKLEKIQFTGEGGRGEVAAEEVVEDLTLTEAITDDYKLSGDTTVNINKATLGRNAIGVYNARMHSKGNPMVVDLNNHALDINVDFTENPRQARGIYVENNSYLNIINGNPDKAISINVGTKDTSGAQGIYLHNGTHLNIDSDVNITVDSPTSGSAAGIQVQGQAAELVINGNLTIKDVIAEGRRANEKTISGVQVTGSDESKVIVNGLVDIRGIKGAALRNVGSNSYIGVGGGVIEAVENKALDKAYRAVEVGQGTSEINMQGEEAGTDTVQITGNMFTTGEFKKEVIEYSGGKKFREVKNHGALNVALVNSESFWKGALTYAEYTDYYGEDHSGGFTRVEQGDFNMYLQNGASWTNELQAAALTKLEAQKSEWKGSRVNKLIGGSDKTHAGVIFQKDANNISVNDYSGNTVVFYEHKADAPTEMIGGDFVITKAADNSYIKLVTDSKGLNFADAAADGKKYVKAANVGEAANNGAAGNKVSAADKNLASETMNALAAKLLYTANDGKLSGEVEIAEGLTTEAKQLKIGDISFRTEDNEEEGYKKGQGWYEYEVEKEDPDKEKPEIDVPDKEDPDKEDPDKEKPEIDVPDKEDPDKEDPDKEKPEIDVPDKEDPDKEDPDKEKPEIDVPDKEDGIDSGKKKTDAIAGTESAMTTSMLAWRAGLSDMNERVGDLRYGKDAGIWARATGGKVKYENKGAEFSNSFKGIEVGADKKLANGWYVGGAFNYSDGDAKYKLGGTGDPKMYMFNAYGTKINDDGSYLDVTAKVGRVENEFTTYSQYRLMELKGDYHSTGYGLSVEYGKRLEYGQGWFEPQAQLSFGRLGGADYTATTDGGASMDIHQDGMNSVIGRLGVAAGTESENGSLYIKASLLHEFSGDMTSTTYEAEKAVAFDTEFDDTWGELALGGTCKMSDNSYLYGDFVKSFGGDYSVDWKVNAGLRFSF